MAKKAKKSAKKTAKKKGGSKSKASKKKGSKKSKPAKKKKTAKKKTAKKKSAPKKAKKAKKKAAPKKAKKKAAKKARKPAAKKAAPKAKPAAESHSNDSNIMSSSSMDSGSLFSTSHQSNEEEEEERRKPFQPHITQIKPGVPAPNFEGIDQHGRHVSKRDFAGKTIILFFYPKDDTEGCTKEACSLRDEYRYLNNNNYAVVGVSADDEYSHKKFADKYELPFTLIADVDKKIIRAYDVWGQKQLAGNIYDGIVRTTFIISPFGMIKDVITKVDTANHAQQILELNNTTV